MRYLYHLMNKYRDFRAKAEKSLKLLLAGKAMYIITAVMINLACLKYLIWDTLF